MGKQSEGDKSAGCLILCIAAVVAVAVIGFAVKHVNSKGRGAEEFSGMATDRSGYITVTRGEIVGFPVYNSAVNPELFCLNDVFEIVGVLGSPTDKSGLTDFAEGEATLILRNHNAASPQFFLFQWLGDGRVTFPEFTVLFENSTFEDQAGYPVTKPTGFLLYVQADKYPVKGRRYVSFEPDETRRFCPLQIGEIDNRQAGIYANVFNGQETGKLIIIVKDGTVDISVGFLSSRNEDLRTVIIHRRHVKLVAVSDYQLPNPSIDLLNQFSDQLQGIDWDGQDSKPGQP